MRARTASRFEVDDELWARSRRAAMRLDVPVYLFTGDHGLAARRDLARDRFERLRAPIKRLYRYEDAGHATAFEHCRDLHRTMTSTVVPQT